MKNRVHYGEFTLDYWLEQLISGGIVLPEYQRSFVWSKEGSPAKPCVFFLFFPFKVVHLQNT